MVKTVTEAKAYMWKLVDTVLQQRMDQTARALARLVSKRLVAAGVDFFNSAPLASNLFL